MGNKKRGQRKGKEKRRKKKWRGKRNGKGEEKGRENNAFVSVSENAISQYIGMVGGGGVSLRNS